MPQIIDIYQHDKRMTLPQVIEKNRLIKQGWEFKKYTGYGEVLLTSKDFNKATFIDEDGKLKTYHLDME